MLEFKEREPFRKALSAMPDQDQTDTSSDDDDRDGD